MNDQQAFELLKQNDKATMEWVYRTKRNAFIGYFIKKYQLSELQAKDLAMDALIALVNFAKGDTNRVLTAQLQTLWIAIGRNIYLGENKKDLQLPIVNWDDFTEYIKNTEGGENPFDSTDFEDVLPFVEPYVHKMGNLCRLILTFYYWENKTDREISDIINADESIEKNMSEAAVKMKRGRCTETLRTNIFNHLK